MEHNKITITLEEYKELIIAAEKVATAERLCKQSGYVSTGELKAVLGIPETESKGENSNA